MAKRAVLIGINYPGTDNELKGCVNDVRRMQKSLVERYGFAEEDIKVLIDTDESYTQPTGKNIRHALSELIKSAKSGDVFFVHYSGHGIRLPLETGEEDDTGFDECIVPCDMNPIPGKLIIDQLRTVFARFGLRFDTCFIDDDFREIVEKVPEGCHITIVSDSCHSGGLIDEAKEQIGESTKKNPDQEGHEKMWNLLHHAFVKMLEFCGIWSSSKEGHEIETREIVEGERYGRYLPLESFVNLLKQKTGKDTVETGEIRLTLFDVFGEDSSPKVKKFMKTILAKLNNDQEGSSSNGLFSDRGILLSGCQTNETSADVTKRGEAYGAFSNAIQMVLSEIKEGKITNKEMVLKAREILKKQGFTQRPGLYCNDRFVNASFIC